MGLTCMIVLDSMLVTSGEIDCKTYILISRYGTH